MLISLNDKNFLRQFLNHLLLKARLPSTLNDILMAGRVKINAIHRNSMPTAYSQRIMTIGIIFLNIESKVIIYFKTNRD